MASSKDKDEYHLRVYDGRSELFQNNSAIEIFEEGLNTRQAIARFKEIKSALSSGYLQNKIECLRDDPSKLDISALDKSLQSLIDELVESVTSEVGRAMTGLAVLQLTVKALSPNQSIRLHKGGSRSTRFGWKEGLSMRSVDRQFITPVLRQYGLLKINSHGVMMTRTLAENYPYTLVYKADCKGARVAWLLLVEEIEKSPSIAEPTLELLLCRLLNAAAGVEELGNEVIKLVSNFLSQDGTNQATAVQAIIQSHIDTSVYAARLLEIAMHSLLQAEQELGLLEERNLVPLSQMRSANKKHGNVGDIEISDGHNILEAWDAKYGKSYLRDELEELFDKLESHPSVEIAGFVSNEEPARMQELRERIDDIEGLLGVRVEILTFDRWVRSRIEKASVIDETAIQQLPARWLVAYAESIAQKRRSAAPIDEPCVDWLTALKKVLSDSMESQSRT